MTSGEPPAAGSGRLRIVLGCAAVLVAVCLLVLYGLDRNGVSPLWLLALAGLVSLAFPMLRTNFFPSARDCAAEYAFHESRLAEAHRQRITAAFSPDAFDRLFDGPERFADAAGDHLHPMLSDARAAEDNDLHFALLMTLARFHETQGDLETSMGFISQALSLNPRHFIANFRMAMLSEWNETPGKALAHYRQALTDPDGLSRAMVKLAAAQIDRIENDAGPPMVGDPVRGRGENE